jgi:hypothetical protein
MSIFKSITKNTTIEDKQYIIKCSCGSAEHLIQVSWFPPNKYDDGKEVYIHYSLLKFRLLKRIWYAIKYVFGYQSRFGGYAEMVLYPEDVEGLIEILQESQKELNSK